MLETFSALVAWTSISRFKSYLRKTLSRPLESIVVPLFRLKYWALDLRREELKLMYLIQVKSAPQNPSLHVFKEDTYSQRFHSPRSSKIWGGLGFQFKTSGNSESRTFGNSSLAFLRNMYGMCDKPVPKKNRCGEEIRSRFLEQCYTFEPNQIVCRWFIVEQWCWLRLIVRIQHMFPRCLICIHIYCIIDSCSLLWI